jgi:DNA primase
MRLINQLYQDNQYDFGQGGVMDTTLINSTTDLAAMVPGLRRRGRYFVGPCPFCGGEDRFNIKRTGEGDLWICRRCGDGKYHDAVAFLMRRDGLSFIEVVGEERDTRYEIRDTIGEGRATSDEPRVTIDEPPDQDWQITTLVALKDCADYLHHSGAPDAAACWRYLRRRRGLTPDTIFRAMLGYNPAWREVAPGRWLAPGITIPGMVDGELWYAQVRTTAAARATSGRRGKTLAKYSALPGSRLGMLFNADAILRALAEGPVTAVIVEGEFDAILLGQYLPPNWAAVTMGSAGSLPGLNWLPYLAVCRRVLVSLDSDEAGQAALARWRKLAPSAEPLAVLPDGAKDITAFWQAGGDVAAWVGEIRDTKYEIRNTSDE